SHAPSASTLALLCSREPDLFFHRPGGRPHAVNTIGRDRRTNPGPAHQDSVLGGSACVVAPDRRGELQIIARRLAIRAPIGDLVALRGSFRRNRSSSKNPAWSAPMGNLIGA